MLPFIIIGKINFSIQFFHFEIISDLQEKYKECFSQKCITLNALVIPTNKDKFRKNKDILLLPHNVTIKIRLTLTLLLCNPQDPPPPSCSNFTSCQKMSFIAKGWHFVFNYVSLIFTNLKQFVFPWFSLLQHFLRISGQLFFRLFLIWACLMFPYN